MLGWRQHLAATPVRIRFFVAVVCFSCLTLGWFFMALSPVQAPAASASQFSDAAIVNASDTTSDEDKSCRLVDDNEKKDADEQRAAEELAEQQRRDSELAWVASLRPGDCDPLLPHCDVAWRHWLLDGKITSVLDPPDCCRGWHAFDMFTVVYEQGGYRGILKIRKQAEMTSDLVSYHIERLLQLNRTLPVFGVVLDRQRYEQLLGQLKSQGVSQDDAQRRQRRWDDMMLLHQWVGRVAGEFQPFIERPFLRVDGSVCAKMPGEELHPRVVFRCLDNGTLPADAPQFGHQGARRSLEERELTCRAQRQDIVDLLVFDYIANQVDRKGNCFVDTDTGRLLFLDNDSGSWDPQRPYPEGSGCCYPSLKRVRLRDILDDHKRVAPVNCNFASRTVDVLRKAAARPGGFGAMLKASLSRDPTFEFIDAAFSNFQTFDPYHVTNQRVARLLQFVDECLAAFGPDQVFID